MHIRVLLIPILLVAALSSCRNTSQEAPVAAADQTIRRQVADSLLLQPGESAGALYLDSNAATAIATLGRPDAGDAAMQKSVSIWYDGHDTTATTLSIYAARDTGENPISRIQQIRVTNPAFKTVEGLGVGLNMASIAKVFTIRELPELAQRGVGTRVFDSLQGIAFEVSSPDVCTAIIIHTAGEPLKGTYLTFR